MQTFEVKDYAHQEGDQCKFEVFSVGKMILSLEPVEGLFRVCKNPGELDENTIHAIIDQIESYHL